MVHLGLMIQQKSFTLLFHILLVFLLRVSPQDLQALEATAFNPTAMTGFQDSFVTYPRPFVQTL